MADMHAVPDGPIQVLFCANPGYFQHMAVAGVSLAEAMPGASLHLHLMTCDQDPAGEARLRETFARYPNVRLTLHHAKEFRLDGFFVDKFMTKECYLRLLAPEVLPPEVERFIYLDCDLVVADDLRPLWDLDLRGRLVAAAPDYPRLAPVISPERRALLGIPLEATYVNSGVLVVDAARWRREGMTARIFDYVGRMGDALTFYDQDAVNAVLAKEILPLDCRWNLQARMYRSGRRAFPLEFAATREARRNPAIIHYTGSEKPWLFRSRTPCKGNYLRHLDRTPWRGTLPRLASPFERLELRLDRALSRIGVDYLQVLHDLGRLQARAARLLGRGGKWVQAPGGAGR